MRIEAASQGDIDAIVGLVESIHELHCSLAPGYFHAADRELIAIEFAKLILETDTRVLIAWEGKLPVAYCVLKIVEREPTTWSRGFRRLLVDSISVGPEWQRKGVGTELMEAAIQIAIGEGISEVVLEYWSNNDAARQFYKSLNFMPLTEKVLLNIGAGE